MKTSTRLLAAAVVAACAVPCLALGPVTSAGAASTLEQAQAACRKTASGAAMSLPSASEYFELIKESDFKRAKEAQIELKLRGQASSIYPLWTEEGLVTMQDGAGMDMSRVDPDQLRAAISEAELSIEKDDSADPGRVAEARANVDALKSALKKGFPVYCVARAGS